MSVFSQRLSNLMKENSYTQQNIADLLCVRRQTIGKYTTDIAEPNMDALIKLADFFEVAIDYLLGREDDFGNVTVLSSKTQQKTLRDDQQKLLDAYETLTLGMREYMLNNMLTLAKQTQA